MPSFMKVSKFAQFHWKTELFPYLLLYGLHDCTFNYFRKKASSLMLKNVPNNHNLAIIAVWILIKMELDFLPALGLAR